MSVSIIKGGIESGSISYGANSKVNYYKRGDVVTVCVIYNVSDGTINSWSGVDLGTLPLGFRPIPAGVTPNYVMARCVSDRSSSVGAALVVYRGGKVSISSRYSAITDTSDVLNCTVTYVAGANISS